MLSNEQVELLTKKRMFEDEILEGILHDYVSEKHMNKVTDYEEAYNTAYQTNTVRSFLEKITQHGIYDKELEQILIDYIFEG